MSDLEKAAQQEPVGQLMEEAYGRGQVLWFNKPDDFSMLYTSPQRKPWVGLTDISELVEAELTHYWNGEYADTTGARDQLADFARAIEAKLKEKNA